MPDRRLPEQKLRHDALRFKQDLQRVRLERDHQAVLLAEQRAVLIAQHLTGRLVFEDFDRYIGVARVLDGDGRIDFREVDVQVRALLLRRPELGAAAAVVSAPAR